ncbi:MAG: hypothetical protein MMC23_001149 [Stictis urceolatum]|nr:hypothetical protein [Stictis urceolata]
MASPSAPRILIIGAGSRGHSYAKVLTASHSAIIQSVAEPIAFKRHDFVRKYISPNGVPEEDAAFTSWTQFLKYEKTRRERAAAGERVLPGVDAIFVCTLDHTHREIIEAFAPLELSVMCEKPLATSLEDCLAIYRAMEKVEGGNEADRANGVNGNGKGSGQKGVFGIGHVLRYSPHNMMLRKLLLEGKAIGDVISVEHTEPVGWWHFSHSYVRGNWRRESTTAPSLLTKSCHDIDFLLWLLTSPLDPSAPPHLPSAVSSTGRLSYFKPSRKPSLAGAATNCLSCPAEPSCNYSAKKIYLTHQLEKGNTSWPVKIVDPEIEDCVRTSGLDTARRRLLHELSADYDESTPAAEVEGRSWYGRCVYASDNDVCDDQTVTITWDEEDVEAGKGAKSATFHMIAFSEAQCDRRGRIYGTEGEIEYDSKMIRVYRFKDRVAEKFWPKQMGGGHGGGDAGLAGQFVEAVRRVKNEGWTVERAQREFVGCSVEDVLRSHALVFCAEEARREEKVVRWSEWWDRRVGVGG